MKKQFIDYININTHNRIDKEKINEIADDFINMNNKNITVYCIAQYIFLTSLKNVELLYPTTQFDNNMIFPPCPYMIYKTPIKFDRIKNQSGVFIYQGFIDYSANVLQKIHGNSSYGLAVQKIIPDLTIKVNNQDEIISDLNLIGINDKYIYGDYDTTAKYINNSIFL